MRAWSPPPALEEFVGSCRESLVHPETGPALLGPLEPDAT